MIVIWLSLLWLGLCGGQTITFDLSKGNSELYTQYANLTVGLTEIQVTNVPKDVGFYILQVHSYSYNVSLSSSHKLKSSSTITGTNLGLVALSSKNTSFYVKSNNQTRALIVVITYNSQDPIPGGCNLTFNTEIAPYQLVSYTDDLIVVQSQPPSAPGTTCEKNNIKVEMYHLFLHENVFDDSFYFNGLEKMLTANSIKRNGYKVTTVDGYYKYRKLYSAYRGVGQVFAIVATYANRTSAYVPAVSYGCDLNNREETCNGPVTPHWKLMCAILFIFGLFVCFYGHRFFRITLYLMGLAVGVFITYVILSCNDYLTVPEKTTTSMLIGLVYGSVWVLIWWKFGSPIISVSLTFFVAGFLMASIIYYAGVADLLVFHNDINFWVTFVSIIFAFLILWTMFTLEGHIFGCSFLGSYACVSALNYYTGGNLQYIIINSFRRMVVKDFNMATIDPPFQILDVWQSILWILLTTFGFYYQMKEQRGKPPFPPPRYATVEEGVNESTPLVPNNAVIYSDI